MPAVLSIGCFIVAGLLFSAWFLNDAATAYFAVVNRAVTGYATPSADSALMNLLPGFVMLLVIAAAMGAYLLVLKQKEPDTIIDFFIKLMFGAAVAQIVIGLFAMLGVSAAFLKPMPAGMASLVALWFFTVMSGGGFRFSRPLGYITCGAALLLCAFSMIGGFPRFGSVVAVLIILPMLDARRKQQLVFLAVGLAGALIADLLFAFGDASVSQIPLSRFAIIFSFGSAVTCACLFVEGRQRLNALLLAMFTAMALTLIYVIKRPEIMYQAIEAGLGFSLIFLTVVFLAPMFAGHDAAPELAQSPTLDA